MRPLFVGIAGGSGSGKTTVARRIAADLAPAKVAHVDMDAYYKNRTDLTLEERRRVNWDHPDSVDVDLFVTQLDALARREPVQKPVYDYATHLRDTRPEEMAAGDAVIVDGILVLADERVRSRLDVKVFVDADADERLVRRLNRDIADRGRPLDEIVDQYMSTVRPMHLQFVEPSKRYADVIVPRGGENAVAIGMIVSLVRQRLEAA
jgi:uridine kinase